MSARTHTRCGFLKKATLGARPTGSGVLAFSDHPAAAEGKAQNRIAVSIEDPSIGLRIIRRQPGSASRRSSVLPWYWPSNLSG